MSTAHFLSDFFPDNLFVAYLTTLPGLASGIYGEQSGAGAGFFRVLRFPLPIFISPKNSPLS
jgi:hypothetical protein